MTLTTCFGQIKHGDSLTVQEISFFYKDSIDNSVSFGDYEPTGFVSFDDGSLIVSTEFSIDFPGRYQKEIKNKSHISSGSVFKLSSNFEKKWEVIFKDHRVMKIGKLPDESIIVAGERIDMEKFWMAQIDTTGKVIWQKEYKLQWSSRIADMAVDSSGNAFLLVEADRRSDGNIIYLLKVSRKGKIKWTRGLDNRDGFEKFGYDIFLEKNIFVTTSYQGFIKQGKDWIKEEGKIVYEVNNKGEIINSTPYDNHFLYHYNNNYFSCTTGKDTLILYTNNSIQPIPTDTIWLEGRSQYVWIYNSVTSIDFIYLICSDNFDYKVIQLNKDNKYIGRWNNIKTVAPNFIDATAKPDGTIVILGKGFKEAKGSNNELITYINFTVIKKNGI